MKYPVFVTVQSFTVTSQNAFKITFSDGSLAKNMPKRLAGYYLLNSYLLSYFRGSLFPCKGKTIRKNVAGHIPDLFLFIRQIAEILRKFLKTKIAVENKTNL